MLSCYATPHSTLNRVRAAAPARQRTGRAMRHAPTWGIHGSNTPALGPSQRTPSETNHEPHNTSMRMYAAAPSTEGEHARRLSKPQPRRSSRSAACVPHCAGRETAAVAESGLRPRGLAAALLRSGTLPLTLSLTLTLTLAEDTPPPREHARPGRRAKLRSRAAPSSLTLSLTPNHA